MTSWPVRYLSALCVAFFCGSAGAQEPFKEMNRLLDEAGADRSHFFSVAPTQQSITYPNLRGSGNRPSFEVLDEFLYALNIRKFVYFVDDKTADIAPGYAVNPAPLWTIPDHLNWMKDYVDLRDSAFIVPLGLRTNVKIAETEQWTEGNSEFAIARGTYDYRNFISQAEWTNVPFKLIVERHPASDGWFLSSYKAVRSEAARDWEPGVGKAITDFAKQYATLVDERRTAAMAPAYAELEAKHFGNYRLRGGILYIDLGERKMLVQQRPTILTEADSRKLKQTRLGAAVDHCAADEAGGLTNWELPGQVALAQMLFGAPFDKWQRMKIKDMPTGKFFQHLLARLPRNLGKATIISKDEADSGQNLNNRVTYVIRIDPENRLFWPDDPFYNAASFSFERMAIVCVNYDQADIARFLAAG